MKKLLILALTVPLALAGCTSAQLSTATEDITDTVQAATSVICQIIPTAVSIGDVIAAIAGGSAITAITGPIITAVENDICTAAPPAASARFRALPRMTAGARPSIIGQTKSGVVIQGFRS